jgi:RNA polymerase sigma-70 factor (ECF subfamily)
MTVAEYNKSVDDFADRLFRFVVKSVKDEDLANDIVQETFTRLWEKVSSVNYAKVRSYLFTAAYHIVLNTFRKEERIEKMDNITVNNYSHEKQYTDLKEVLNNALEQLPEIQKTVVLLRDYEGYSYKEIAELTKINAPDLRIVYKYKSRLKHFVFERKTVTRVLGYLSAAVFLSFTLFFFVNDNNDITQKPVVSKIIDDNEPTHQTKSTEIIPSSNDLRGAGSGSTKKQGMISKEKQVPKHVRPVENSISKVMVNSKSRREVKGEERLLTRLDPKLINKIYYEGQPLPMDLKVPSKRSNSRIVDKRDFIHPTNQVNDGKITIWKIAEIGLNGFNKLNETNYMLQKNYNASGELTSVSLITNQRIITTSAI